MSDVGQLGLFFYIITVAKIIDQSATAKAYL